MANLVNITISGVQDGATQIAPYSHAAGLQRHPRGTPNQNRLIVYSVPTYAVQVRGGNKYIAVRFGLQNNGRYPPRASRLCDAGLTQARVCTPSWVPTYSPHSFAGASRPGAWRLIPGKAFLIHEGADRALSQVGGSLGCVEILDGKWNDFLAEIEQLGGDTCARIAAAKKLRVTVEASAYPMATLV